MREHKEKNPGLPDDPNSSVGFGAFTANSHLNYLSLIGIEKMTSLQSLNLNDVAIHDKALGEISKLTQLNDLNLSQTKITDIGLSHLSKMSSLRKLDISNTAVTDIKELAKLPLTDLNLSNTKITSQNLESVLEMRNLNSLNISGITISKSLFDKIKSLNIPELIAKNIRLN